MSRLQHRARPQLRSLWLVAAVCIAGAAGCGSEGSAGGPAAGFAQEQASQDAGAVGDTGAGGSASSSGGSSSSSGGSWGGWKPDAGPLDAGKDAYVPKEVEKDDPFGAPEGTDNFVYIPVSGADTVVKVSGTTLKVSLVEVGDKPAVIRAIPNQDGVAVLNAGSADVSVLRSTETSDTVESVPILANCNQLDISPTGGHAVAWYDHGKAQKGDPTGSFQAVSVISLESGKQASVMVSVGFRPRDVQFDIGGNKAFIITNDGISAIELAKAKAGAVAVPIKVSNHPVVNPATVEVHVDPSGVWSVARLPGSVTLSVLNMASKAILDVTLPSQPTDLDLAPDGSGALLVMPATKHVGWVDLPGAATDTLAVKIATIHWLQAGLARITDDGKTAVLYTSVPGVENAATLDLQSGVVKPVKLRKTVDYVVLPAGSRKAILVHKPAAGPSYNDDKVEAFVDDAEGYTVFDLDSGYTKLFVTPNAIGSIATSEKPSKAMMLLADPKGAKHTVDVVELDTFLSQSIVLGSAPEFGRVLSKAGVVAVTQQHPSGRISFIDLQTNKAKTVTGFELNGLVK